MRTAVSQALKIGCHEDLSPVVLAPMSGVTDLPFRRIANELSGVMVVSEMIASRELVAQRRDVVRRAQGAELSPFVVQLAGREARWMAEGARLACDAGAQIIDINMGCPAREVTGRLSGSALMRDIDLATELIAATVAAVDVPVTLKMRLGWDARSINAADLARRAEAEGVQAITVHGRTRCQFFKGRADWARVRDVVDEVRVPVLVNGDIVSPQDAQAALAASGAAGVMIGRGAYGAPWQPGRVARFLASGIDPGPPGLGVQARIASRHVSDMLDHYGTWLGLRNARKHVGWYLARACSCESQVRQWRRRLCTEENPQRLMAGLGEFYGEMCEASG